MHEPYQASLTALRSQSREQKIKARNTSCQYGRKLSFVARWLKLLLLKRPRGQGQILKNRRAKYPPICIHWADGQNRPRSVPGLALLKCINQTYLVPMPNLSTQIPYIRKRSRKRGHTISLYSACTPYARLMNSPGRCVAWKQKQTAKKMYRVKREALLRKRKTGIHHFLLVCLHPIHWVDEQSRETCG